MKVLVIGSGGREHAIAWKLSQSKRVSELYCAPGNPGIAAIAENIVLAVDDLDGIVSFSEKQSIDLVVVGPELPLTLGLVDRLKDAGIAVFGPTQAAAKMEESKAHAKEVMAEAGVPTAAYRKCTDADAALAYVREQGAPIVVKADGLAAGKGVFVCSSLAEAEDAVDKVFGALASDSVVIEEMLEGVEVSFIVATDGTRVYPLAASHDYKRAFDNDEGPNTGGMGTVCPTPRLSPEQAEWTMTNVMQPTVDTLRKRGTPFVGFLYAGLMLAPSGEIKVLEFNVRLGDPEAQVILARLKTDLFELLYPLATGNQAEALGQAESLPETAVCVVMAAKGYPESPRKGDRIEGISEAEALSSCVVFHAGTAKEGNGALTTAGGRVLGVTVLGPDLESARLKTYQCCEIISFDGAHYRTDIGRVDVEQTEG